MTMNDALELAKKLDTDYLKCVDEWGCKPEFLVLKSNVLEIPGVFPLVFFKKWINNKECIFFRNSIQVLQIDFLTNGEFPYKFVR